MTTDSPTNKLPIEEVEAYAMDLAVPRGKNSDDFLYHMACQLVDTMRDNLRLRKALWYISVNSMPPGKDWCEVPTRVAKWAEKALASSKHSVKGE